jgi:hypothetical protein
LKKTRRPAKVFSLVLGTLIYLSSNAQVVGTFPSYHSPVDVRACGSYTLPPLNAGNYFTGPDAGGIKMKAGDVLTQTQTVYVRRGSKQAPQEDRFTVTIDAMPVINFFLHGSRRDPGQVSLQATPDTGTIKWYETESGGLAIGTGTGFKTPSISKNTVYYAEAVNGACVSDRIELLAMIAPSTWLRSSDCGKSLADLNEKIFCEPVKRASRYRFEVAYEGKKQVVVGVSGYFSMKECKDLKMNAVYSVRVAAEVDGSWGDYGPACTIITPSGVIAQETTLEIDENLLPGFSLEAYPNPNNGDFLLVSSHEGEFKIYSEHGKLVKAVKITKENDFGIRIDGLKSGVYFVVGNIYNNVVMSKVMVVR